MRKIIFLFICFSSFYSYANNIGLGLIIGSPTGISGKYLLDRDNAIDGALAWSLGDKNHIHIHSDYLWHKPNVFKDQNTSIDLFYGVGARLVGAEDTKFGPRFPIGLRHNFRDPDIEVFLEAAIILNLISKTDLNIDIGLGGRYYW